MSPVLIPNGYTKDYIDGKISYYDQLKNIENAVKNVNSRNEVVLCEGTGHCAVGSIVGASNAKVASMVGGSMVLIANGGLGKDIHKYVYMRENVNEEKKGGNIYFFDMIVMCHVSHFFYKCL